MAKTRTTVGGVERTIQALRHWGRKHSDARYTVSYRAPYAAPVHENLRVNHPTGQAKFLETPARTQANRIAAVTRQAVKNGDPLEVGLRKAAEFLLAESRKLVPVDTGFLRNSGKVEREVR